MKFKLSLLLIFLMVGFVFAADSWIAPTTHFNSSGSHGSFPEIRSYDTNVGTFWYGVTSIQHYITYDMGESKDITAVGIHGGGAYFHCCADLEYSTDNVSYSVAIADCDDGDKAWGNCTFSEVTGRYFRLSGIPVRTSCGSCPVSNGITRVYEFQLYGDTAAATTTTTTTTTTTSTTTTTLEGGVKHEIIKYDLNTIMGGIIRWIKNL